MSNREPLTPERLFERMRQLSKWLEDKSAEHLYDEDLYRTFYSEIGSLEKNIQMARDKARKLCIGIIGQVKAGKSTFLNTIVFDGKQVLPKAATPMTAALTKLSYSETPKAIVHYYSQEEWNKLVKANEDFEANLQNAYEQYLEDHMKKHASSGSFFPGDYTPPPPAPLSLEDYAKKRFKSTQSEYLKAGRELVQMVQDQSILEKVGTEEHLEMPSEDALMNSLKAFVGADGKYTPIVNYVELMLPNEQLKDLTIIDTPGLNDPITSRTIKTKDFLSECDVAFLLSPCSQFMDAKTIELMAERFPDKGIENIVVVGSKFDSGLCNEKGSAFRDAYPKSVHSYESTFFSNINRAKQNSRNKSTIELFAKNDISDRTIFFSSMCFLLDKALKAKQPFASQSEEETVYNNLHALGGFQDNLLKQLSGVDKIKLAMKKVLEKKESIISGKNSKFLRRAWENFLGLLNQIQDSAHLHKKNLEEMGDDSPEQILKRFNTMENILISSRKKIQAIFETAGYQAEKSALSIKHTCGIEMVNYDDFKVDKYVENTQHHETHWFKADSDWTTTETTYRADIAQVLTNINSYAGKCHEHAVEGFSYLFNEENLKHRLTSIITDAFKKSGYNYDVDDVLFPLETIFAKISIPQVKIDVHPYKDKLKSYFPQGVAENEEVHTLHTIQVECLTDIKLDLEKQIDASVEENIKPSMTKQAATFVDEISKKLQATKMDLMELLKDKEQSIQTINDFIQRLKKEKLDLAQEM